MCGDLSKTLSNLTHHPRGKYEKPTTLVSKCVEFPQKRKKKKEKMKI